MLLPFFRVCIPNGNLNFISLQHHWSDVSAGALIGAVSASLTARYVSCLVGARPEEQNGDAESLTLTAAHSGRYRQSSGHQNDVESARGSKEQSVSAPPFDSTRIQ